MIHDRIENLSRYNIPMAGDILRFLKEQDPLKVPVGEIEIKGRELFVRLAEYMTRRPDEGRFETHRVYADVQYVVRSSEAMQTAPTEGLSSLGAYDPAGDVEFFKADDAISSTVVRAGEFTVYFPGEAHRPMCHPGNTPVNVRKLVFKIRMK